MTRDHAVFSRRLYRRRVGGGGERLVPLLATDLQLLPIERRHFDPARATTPRTIAAQHNFNIVHWASR